MDTVSNARISEYYGNMLKLALESGFSINRAKSKRGGIVSRAVLAACIRELHPLPDAKKQAQSFDPALLLGGSEREMLSSLTTHLYSAGVPPNEVSRVRVFLKDMHIRYVHDYFHELGKKARPSRAGYGGLVREMVPPIDTGYILHDVLARPAVNGHFVSQSNRLREVSSARRETRSRE